MLFRSLAALFSVPSNLAAFPLGTSLTCRIPRTLAAFSPASARDPFSAPPLLTAWSPLAPLLPDLDLPLLDEPGCKCPAERPVGGGAGGGGCGREGGGNRGEDEKKSEAGESYDDVGGLGRYAFPLCDPASPLSPIENLATFPPHPPRTSGVISWDGPCRRLSRPELKRDE